MPDMAIARRGMRLASHGCQYLQYPRPVRRRFGRQQRQRPPGSGESPYRQIAMAPRFWTLLHTSRRDDADGHPR